MEARKAFNDFWVLGSEIGHFRRIHSKISQKQGIVLSKGSFVGTVFRVAEQFPVAFADNPFRIFTAAEVPIEGFVGRVCVVVLNDVFNGFAIDVVSGKFDTTKFRKRGEPVDSGYHLVPHLVLRDHSGKRDD